MKKHAVAVTATVGSSLGFLTGILYSIYKENRQLTHDTIDRQGSSIDKLSGKIDDLAFHQKNLWGTIHKLQTDLHAVSKGVPKPAP